MTEAMPFLQKYDITFLRPPTIPGGNRFFDDGSDGSAKELSELLEEGPIDSAKGQL